MNERQMTRGADGGRLCQADGCLLPPSLLPWMIEMGDVTLVLWLCQEHGGAVTGQGTADAGGEAA